MSEPDRIGTYDVAVIVVIKLLLRTLREDGVLTLEQLDRMRSRNLEKRRHALTTGVPGFDAAVIALVDMIITDLAVFQRPDHDSPFKLIELAPGVTAEEVAAKTTAHYVS